MAVRRKISASWFAGGLSTCCARQSIRSRSQLCSLSMASLDTGSFHWNGNEWPGVDDHSGNWFPASTTTTVQTIIGTFHLAMQRFRKSFNGQRCYGMFVMYVIFWNSSNHCVLQIILRRAFATVFSRIFLSRVGIEPSYGDSSTHDIESRTSLPMKCYLVVLGVGVGVGVEIFNTIEFDSNTRVKENFSNCLSRD